MERPTGIAAEHILEKKVQLKAERFPRSSKKIILRNEPIGISLSWEQVLKEGNLSWESD